MKNRKWRYLLGDAIGMLVAAIVFIIPFAFMLVNALKDRKEANLLELSLPKIPKFHNFIEVFQANNYQIVTAFKNSVIIVTGAVILLIMVGAMGGYVLQRRKDKITALFNTLIMFGLMVPAAILPTIWVLQKIGLYKTLCGMIFIEVALQMPFTIMLYRGFMSSIPLELEEAGYIDGCSRWRLFTSIIFPLLKPVTATVIILNAVSIFNDFTNPLYFLPGAKNATVQLTLYNFMGQYSSSYNLLFANVILITIPMLILFIIFNKKIVDGMVAGAVKG
ncbi:carbohydrate ABC transporter permease [Robinsoniella peoriensis]|uniref:carbohydrate ABC transporter permease n=1 Tax=Robinsoniella peoriensis TaxID=180332 RepID=UPI00085C1D04|nr:carbohydrate ABC transporter permease [Robinsoniella peoriensis]